MSWRLRIAYDDRDDGLLEMLDATRGLSREDAAVTRAFLFNELTSGGVETAGELEDRLEKATPAVRRKMLDDARERAGLKSATRLEFEAEHERSQFAASARARAIEQNPGAVRLEMTDAGTFREVDEFENERIRRKEDSARRLREQRLQERALEAAEHDRMERAWGEALAPANSMVEAL